MFLNTTTTSRKNVFLPKPLSASQGEELARLQTETGHVSTALATVYLPPATTQVHGCNFDADADAKFGTSDAIVMFFMVLFISSDMISNSWQRVWFLECTGVFEDERCELFSVLGLPLKVQ